MGILNKSVTHSCRIGILLSFLVCIFPAFHDGYPIPAGFLELFAVAINPVLGVGILLGQVLLIVAALRGTDVFKNIFTIVSIGLFIACWIYMAMDVHQHQFDLTITIASSVPFACCVLWYFALLLLG